MARPRDRADQSQGAQLAKLQELVGYWGTGYDWRKAEAKLNALPQFITEIDGLDIHFIHVRSRHPNALPLIMTHGWPGSILELLKVIGPLTDPTAHGGTRGGRLRPRHPVDARLRLLRQPTAPGWDPDRIAPAWDELMGRLGYAVRLAGRRLGRGDHGAMARQAPPGCAASTSTCRAVPPEIEAALAGDGPAPAMTEQERAAFDALAAYRNAVLGLLVAVTARRRPSATRWPTRRQAWRPWSYDKFAHWTYGGDPARARPSDEMLDDITLYWLTNTATSSGRMYWENRGASPNNSTR